MTTTVNDVDELEALLGGLSDDELNDLMDTPASSSPSIDLDIEDAVLLEEPAAKPAKPAPKRRLKPLPEQEPKVEVKPVDEEDADLEALLLDEPELTPLTVNTDTGKVTSDDPEVTGDEELEALLALPGAVAEEPKPVAEPIDEPAPVAKIKPTAKKAGALNTFIDADRLQEDLTFTDANISLAMARQAGLFAHYSELAANAQFQSDRAKQQVELLEAQLNQQYRDALITSGTKPTEKTIDTMVIQDSGYQAALERMHEAKAIAKMVDTAADSFRHKKDMLQMRGADLRLEAQGQLRTKAHPGQSALDSLEK